MLNVLRLADVILQALARIVRPVGLTPTGVDVLRVLATAEGPMTPVSIAARLFVTTGTMSHGQSHETTMAQLVADRLGLDIAQVKVVQGDTDRITYGFGSFASRSITIGGSA